ncbi:MAG: methylated-DNA--[protein]-cysteine S-methyltransferase [Nitrospiraceae bacterium]|nr:MAG: methylated-DNA--[protein]-cysteine S-methyltransferase [Nitrospiraceae bacterium]
MGKRSPSTLPLTPYPSRLRVCVFRTPWGWMGVSETAKGIEAVVLPKTSRQAVLLELGLPSAKLLEGRASPRLREAQAQLIGYLAGTRRSFDLPLDLSHGTSFQQKVWRALRNISYGQLRSYQWVAARVGGRQYARAVGNAVGANPMPIVIPCHRVVAQDMSLGGFSCGLPMKRKLLTLEGILAELRPGRLEG